MNLSMIKTVLTRCKDQFRYYEEQHRAKKTPDADAKAVVNAGMADMVEAALATFDGGAPETGTDTGCMFIGTDPVSGKAKYTCWGTGGPDQVPAIAIREVERHVDADGNWISWGYES